jgi:hypothetical protein
MKSQVVEVYRAYHEGRLRQIGLSAEQVRRLCPESTGVGWTITHALQEVQEATGFVVDWGGREHIHWQCPLCSKEHISDFFPHADSNPVLWFCEGGGENAMCLVYWQRGQG